MPFANAIGRQRADGLYRLLALLILIVTAFIPFAIIAAIGFVAGLIWMIVDVLMQIVTNDAGWGSSTGGLAMWLRRLWEWPRRIIAWIFLGRGSFPWLP